MKLIRRFSFLLIVFLGFISCQKEYSVENGGGVVAGAQWEFKEGSNALKGPVDTAYIEDLGAFKALTVEGSSQNGLDAFILQIFAQDFTVGTYKSPLVLMSYLKNGITTIYETDPLTVDAFTINITKIDSASVTGTFNGVVKDSSGANKTITDGKFSAKLLNNSITPPPPTDGKLSFWASAGCTGATPLTVKINNQTGTITSFTATEPLACDGSGNANFTLPAGNYTWKLYCGPDSVGVGSVNVIANSCIKVRCSVTPLPQTNCKLEKLIEYDSASNGPSYAFVSTYTNTAVTKFQLIDSTSNTVDATFNITYPASKVQLDANQYFTVGTNGRVTEFHGYIDPTDNTSQPVIIKYTYNASGQMTKAGFELTAAPGIEALKIEYAYTGANLTKAEIRTISGLGTYIKVGEVDYQYDLSKSPKNFISLLIGPEITYFQTAINTGVPSANLVTKAISKDYDNNGVLQATSVSEFKNYVIDANNYVKSFHLSGDDYGYIGLYEGYKYVLTYKCF